MLENKIINNRICHIKVKSCIMDLGLRKGILAFHILPSCWSLGTHCHLAQQDHLSSFPQPWHVGLRSSWGAEVLLCAEDEQCQCCGGELIHRPGQFFILHAEARKTETHICSVCCEVHQWIPWGVEIQTRAQWTFPEHCCQATIAHGGLTRRV